MPSTASADTASLSDSSTGSESTPTMKNHDRPKNHERRRISYSQPKPDTSASLPESIAWRVTRSWELVSGKTEKVGVDFFLRLFKDHPQAADLFRFGGDVPDTLNDNKQIPKALKVHAKKVLDTVGVCVAGLAHLPDLVPTLRSLGKFHSSLGVQNFHYDAVYAHLMDAMEAEVGAANFDEDTREAWEIVYRSLTQVMKNPNNVLQMEPLEGWGTVATVACAYLTIATPLQMAYLSVSNPTLTWNLNFFSVLAALILLVDMSSHWIAEYVRPKSVAPASLLAKKSNLQRTIDRFTFPIRYRAVRFIRSLQMDRWVQWQKMEATVLISFPLQYLGYLAKNHPSNYYDGPIIDSGSSTFWDMGGGVGVHWTYAFGLLRLVAAHRVFHAFACAENNFLLRKRQIDTQELSVMRMGKLVVTMLMVIHINACLWCLVARMEFGSGVVDQAYPTAFFPKAKEIFSGKLSVLNAYLHAVHWAWVNLAGIGDCDSTPETTLECLTTLFVHMCGATLYTITTGNVVNILESMSAKRNEIGGDLVELGHFMQTCNVPEDIQKRIMQGYMMKMMIGEGQYGQDSTGAAMNSAPKSPEAVSRLPRHLEVEVSAYYRAEAIRRRDTAFAHCSHEFLIAFVAALKKHKLLLKGENYVHEGQELPAQVALLVEGQMSVLVGGVVVRQLEAGDLIGKSHLFGYSVERVGLRAESTCTLMTGLRDREDVDALQERYARDFSLLMAYRMGQVSQNAAMNDLSCYGLDISASYGGGRRTSITAEFTKAGTPVVEEEEQEHVASDD